MAGGAIEVETLKGLSWGGGHGSMAGGGFVWAGLRLWVAWVRVWLDVSVDDIMDERLFS